MDRDDWNERYSGQELVWTATANQFVVAELEHVEPGRALDLACGEGRNAVWLAEQGWDVTAADFSAAALDKGWQLAQQRGVSVGWIEADVTTWEPPASAFDLVLVAYLHLPAADRATALGHAAAAVAPGGTFLLVAHDRTNLDAGHGGPQNPDLLTTPAEVAAALDGFDIGRAEVAERRVDTDDGPATALDTLVRAAKP